MEKIIRPGRLILMLLALLGLIALYVTQLYKLQIVEGEAYYERSQNSIVTTRTVPAARGSILDRYGRVLVSNRSCSNLYIDTAELFGDFSDEAMARANETILELVEILEGCGDSYIDELPITKEPPFSFTEMSAVDSARLKAYLADKKDEGLTDESSAVELMAYFRERYQIDNNYDARQMRIVAGVRYALNMHYIVPTSDYVFAEDVSIDSITRLMELDVPGFRVEESFVRQYNTAAAAHLIGYVGLMNEAEYEKYGEQGYKLNAVVGKDGAELAFEEYLHGVDGEAQVTANAAGTVISTIYTKEPEPGDNVYLTIDIGLQAAAENILGTFIETTNEQRARENAQAALYGATEDISELITGGSVVVVDIPTGEPLCMASYPSYNLDTLMEDYAELLNNPSAPLFNRALMGTYAPGSTFKMCTAVAALNEGCVEVNTTIYDDVIFTKYADVDTSYLPKCWIYGKGSHGDVNVTSAIKVSCNFYFYTVADYLGIDRLSDYALRFGLGAHTGIELPESVGVMSTQEYKETVIGEPWRAGDTLQAGIGQSFNLFTPLQLAEYVAAVANNGQRHSAALLKSVCSYDYSRSVYDRGEQLLNTVETDQANYDAVKLGMFQVANDPIGTAYQTFWDYPVHVAAKTGTAQTGGDNTNNAIFVCYAPYENPEIAVAIVLEKGKAGSAVSVIARQVMDYYFAFRNSAQALETELTLLK